VHPASYEGWGVAVYQALQYGLPIIASSQTRSGRDYLIEPGVNGLLFETDAELRSQLHNLIESPERRRLMRKAAFAKAAIWSEESMAQRVMAILDDEAQDFPDGGPLALISGKSLRHQTDQRF
jgi:glycosyltransferase involved in cell wall biosynthesis